MIHRVQGKYSEVFVISSNGCHVPGVYTAERAAKYAFRFPNNELQHLQDTVNDAEPDHEKRVITFEMLQELRKAMKAKKDSE